LGYGYNSPAKNWRRWRGLEEPDERQLSAMEWGTAHERDAVAHFEAVLGTIVDRAGDEQLFTPLGDWCGCTTDGLVDEDGLIEAKCPRQMPSSPKEAYWVQVQSQLHITNRQVGYLVIWTPEEAGIWKTLRDPIYWLTVEPTLRAFWTTMLADKPPGRTKKTKADLNISWEKIG
jgi:hypothetical protein